MCISFMLCLKEIGENLSVGTVRIIQIIIEFHINIISCIKRVKFAALKTLTIFGQKTLPKLGRKFEKKNSTCNDRQVGENV
jgi:hypothetical protein